jgi:hypothetical protein
MMPINETPPPYRYQWITEETPAEFPWAAGEPDSLSSLRTVEVRQAAGALYDVHPSFDRTAVCECDEWPALPERFQ